MWVQNPLSYTPAGKPAGPVALCLLWNSGLCAIVIVLRVQTAKQRIRPPPKSFVFIRITSPLRSKRSEDSHHSNPKDMRRHLSGDRDPNQTYLD